MDANSKTDTINRVTTDTGIYWDAAILLFLEKNTGLILEKYFVTLNSF